MTSKGLSRVVPHAGQDLVAVSPEPRVEESEHARQKMWLQVVTTALSLSLSRHRKWLQRSWKSMASAREFLLRIGSVAKCVHVMCVLSESLAVKGEVGFSSVSYWSEGRCVPSQEFHEQHSLPWGLFASYNGNEISEVCLDDYRKVLGMAMYIERVEEK